MTTILTIEMIVAYLCLYYLHYRSTTEKNIYDSDVLNDYDSDVLNDYDSDVLNDFSLPYYALHYR